MTALDPMDADGWFAVTIGYLDDHTDPDLDPVLQAFVCAARAALIEASEQLKLYEASRQLDAEGRPRSEYGAAYEAGQVYVARKVMRRVTEELSKLPHDERGRPLRPDPCGHDDEDD